MAFKVGDKVRCISGLDELVKSLVYTVEEVDKTHIKVSGCGYRYFSERFELEGEVKMFEVGKTYKHYLSEAIYTCVWASETQATLTRDDGEAYLVIQANISRYTEYKAPEIRSVWVNVYPSDDGIARDRFYYSQYMADQMAGATRIKCIELKYEV